MNENNKVIRFIDFHPIHSSEGLFFNILLYIVCFKKKNTLLSFHNKQQSYVYECYNKRIIFDLECIQTYFL